MSSNPTLTDAQTLEALDMRARGLSLDRIAQKLRVSRGTVSGAIYRTLQAAPADPRHDGTMPERWWEAGLKVEGRDAW